MNQNMSYVNFNRQKDLAFASSAGADPNTIYFTSDTNEIIIQGKSYGSADLTQATNDDIAAIFGVENPGSDDVSLSTIGNTLRATPVTTMDSTETEGVSLNSNTYYKWEEPITTLTINLSPSNLDGKIDMYIFRFTTGDSFSLNISGEMKWEGGNAPEWQPNTTYELNIVDSYISYTTF